MKKLLSLILVISITLAVPAKAEIFSVKNIAGAALVTAGIASGFWASKFMRSATKEYPELKKSPLNTTIPFSQQRFDEKLKKNFLHEVFSFALAIASFSAITAGSLLLS